MKAILHLSLLFGSFFFHAQAETGDAKTAILQGSIELHAADSYEKNPCEGKWILPGKSLKCSVVVENSGSEESPKGELFVRYGFAPPIDEKPESILFETEKKPLPSLLPGESQEIFFDKLQQTPSIIDFVHHDWLMREYEAIAVIDKKEKVIGAVGLTLSAYYYPTIKKEYPSKIKAGKLEEGAPPSF